MRVSTIAPRIALAIISLSLPAVSTARERGRAPEANAEITRSAPAVLWRDPAAIASRNLFYGPGGQTHQPHSTLTFLKEDLEGTNPKFDVRDEDGVKWKVKLGSEARSETVASRLTWAVGYFANEDYFLRKLHVQNMPAHLHRGQQLVEPDGAMHDARLKRHLDGEKNLGDWRWRQDPFSGSRELNGLRVMMALINNWDLKDVNNAVYLEGGDEGPGFSERIYMVSDLGASFGTSGLDWPHEKAKGNLRSYTASKFVTKVTPDYVDFKAPARPALLFLFNPHEFFSRLRVCWIGRHIPRADARWIGQLLAQLSREQIGDAFRAAGYSAQEVEGFTQVVGNRIAELNKL